MTLSGVAAGSAPAIAFERVTKTFQLAFERHRSFKDLFVERRGPRPSKARETLTALDDVSFEVHRAATLGLVGPNGTGKSTALKLIARILEPTSGAVHVRGRVAALLELGAGFHPELTGRDNVYLNGSLMGLDRSDMTRRLDRIVDFAELGRFMDVPVKHYSSGMYMRLGFATAVHLDPDILLIDEVLAVGDQAFQAKCRERIAQLKDSAVTIVLVSHDLSATRELCASAIWLESGVVRGAGATDQVVEAYYRSIIAHEEARFAAEAPAPVGLTPQLGTGEIRITACDVLGPDGTAATVVLTGEPVAIRLAYQARERVHAPIFGLAVHTAEGIHVSGPNTRAFGLELDWVEGAGEVRFTVPEWPLLAGSYQISAVVYDETQTHVYDYHHRSFVMRVRGQEQAQGYGLVRLAGEWSHGAKGSPS
jgi:lipopolysaccharide transport system ATP-binding protein